MYAWITADTKWSEKVICYDYDGRLKACYPATYENVYYFYLDHDIALPLPTVTCDITDI